ncbi:MAG TPA: transposase [Polyangiaceae bacterium]|nr:transposase [Polyangiaceae bacterium]
MSSKTLDDGLRVRERGEPGMAARGWGGQRRGAGRKKQRGLESVPHEPRAPVRPQFPRHVTLCLNTRALRTQSVFNAVCAAFRALHRKWGESFRVAEFSVQSDHIHLLIEANTDAALRSGMKSLGARLSHGINRVLGRRGKLYRDRFHDRELTSARAVRVVLAYLFANFRKHQTKEALAGLSRDPFSSAPYFHGFVSADFDTPFAGHGPPEANLPIMRARGRLLSRDWQRHGLLSVGYWPPARVA